MQAEMSRSMLRNALILGLFAVATVGLVAVTQQGTAARIQAAEREAQVRALSEILPPDSYDNHLLDNVRQLVDPLLGSDQPLPAYLALKDGRPTAVIFQAIAPDGYSGKVNLIVAVRADGSLSGMRVTGHRETPGLGDYIDPKKDKNKAAPWIVQFTDLNPASTPLDQWKVRKDGGQIAYHTGATISARAVTNAVARAARFAADNQNRLFAAPSGKPL